MPSNIDGQAEQEVALLLSLVGLSLLKQGEKKKLCPLAMVLSWGHLSADCRQTGHTGVIFSLLQQCSDTPRTSNLSETMLQQEFFFWGA